MRLQPAVFRLGVILSLGGMACTSNKVVPATDTHTDHGVPSSSPGVVTASDNRGLPPDASGALTRLSASPRHSEWAIIRTGDGDSLRVWVVYPERSSKAPVVVVVHYGVSPKTTDLPSVRAPVLGLYGGNDARVDATIPPADSALRALGRIYVPTIYNGAGHGFLRQQTGMDGANMAATRQAWPATIAWFRKYLGS